MQYSDAKKEYIAAFEMKSKNHNFEFLAILIILKKVDHDQPIFLHESKMYYKINFDNVYHSKTWSGRRSARPEDFYIKNIFSTVPSYKIIEQLHLIIVRDSLNIREKSNK